MEYLFRGVRLSLKDPELRKYLIKPFFWSIFLYLCVSLSITWMVSAWITDLIAGWQLPGWVEFLGPRLLAFLAWSFVAGPVFFGLNAVLSSFMWSDLSYRTEIDQYGSAPRVKNTVGAELGDSVARLPRSLGVSFLSLVLGLVGLGWVSAYPVGRVCLLDFTAPAYLRRGIFFGEQKVRVSLIPRSKGFALACGVVSLVPLLNLLCLPGAVIGATLMVRESEGR